MTKVQALQKTILIWTLLAKNPTLEKDDVYTILNLEHDTQYCPLCEHAHRDCRDCLLLDFWSKQPIIMTKPPCCQDDSAYAQWKLTHDPAKARQIIEAATQELREVQGL